MSADALATCGWLLVTGCHGKHPLNVFLATQVRFIVVAQAVVQTHSSNVAGTPKAWQVDDPLQDQEGQSAGAQNAHDVVRQHAPPFCTSGPCRWALSPLTLKS